MIFAANPCLQRSPNQYIAESEEEVQNILNPRLDDLAIVSNEFGRSEWRLRESGDFIVDGVDVLSSNACEYVWVRTPDDDSDFDQAVTAARINALIAADRPVVLPEGEFSLDAAIALGGGSGNVLIEGAGAGRTILDFTSLSGVAINGTGTMTPLPALDAAISLGQMTVTFASAHNLVARDLFVLENTTDGSFNQSRAIYHDGEWFEVAQVLSSTQVLVTQPAFSNYTPGANISMWKVDPIRVRMKGMTIRFPDSLGTNIAGLQVSLGRNVIFEDMDLSGSQYTQIFTDRCFDVRAEDCNFFDTNTTVGNNYGIGLANCQHVRLISLTGRTLRHVISFGGGDADGAVPCRDIQIIGGDFGAAGDTGGAQIAVDFHGNCEWYQVIGVSSKSGLQLGGDNGQVIGGMFGNMNDSGYSIVLSEVSGMNFTIDGSTCYAMRQFQNGLVSCFAKTYTKNPSTLNLRNITYHTGSFTGPRGLDFGVIGVPATSELSVIVDGGSLTTSRSGADDFYAMRCFSFNSVGSAIKTLRISGFKSDKGGFSIVGDVAEGYICNNEISGALRYGIHVSFKSSNVTYATDQKWVIDGNKVPNAMRDAIYFNGSTTYSDPVITNNFAINASQETAGSYTSIRIDGARNAEIAANDVGDTQATATQASIYSASTVTNLLDIRNRNLGMLVNPSLAVVRAGITNLRDDPPTEGPQWDYSADGFAWGSGVTASDTIPYIFRRDRNSLVQWQLQNKPVAGNTLAGCSIQVVAGATGNDASGGLDAWPQDYSSAYRAGKVGVEVNSNADALYLAAPAVGQTIDIYAGSTTRIGRWSSAGLGIGSGSIVIMTGTGSPEGVAVAPTGSLYLRSDGGVNTTLYVKESGVSNTGWIAK